MIRVLPVLCAALLFGGCATRHKTYTAPDPARVNAATRQVEEDLVKARNISREARRFVTDAQKNADTIAAQSASLETKAEKLVVDVPEAFKAEAREILKGIKEQLAAEGELSRNLAGGQAKNDELEAHLTQTDGNVAKLKSEQATYFANAQTLANDATDERESRIGVEKKLSWYRWHWWGSWIALGAGVLTCGIFAFFKFTGRLAMKMP